MSLLMVDGTTMNHTWATFTVAYHAGVTVHEADTALAAVLANGMTDEQWVCAALVKLEASDRG